jgi:hypothetical protein
MLGAVLQTSMTFAGVVLRPVDGGVNYYGQFSNPLPSTLSYFPIGVWYESVRSQANIDLDKDAGLNLYVVLTTDSNLSLVQSNGMRVIIQQDEWSHSGTYNSAVSGWELDDEIDMEQADSAGAAAARAKLTQILASLPKDRRARYNNYGKGVMFWNDNTDAQRYVNQFQQLTSVDTYWFTDNNICSQWEGGALLTHSTRPLTDAECHRAANYGYTVDRMRALDAKDGQRKPVWAFVEVGHPFTYDSWPTIRPAEVRAAVWHSIIAGARGILYFNHSFGGSNTSQHCLREPAYAAVRAVVKSTNQQITNLARVLNAPFADGFVTTTPSVRAMAKHYRDKYYVFAGSKNNKASVATFSLQGISSGTAVVLDEERKIPISGGRFSDNFGDGNAIHIYRIE